MPATQTVEPVPPRPACEVEGCTLNDCPMCRYVAALERRVFGAGAVSHRTTGLVTMPLTDAPKPTRVIARRVIGYAYARNGNAHNPTPRIAWDVMAPDGKVEVSRFRLKDARAYVARYYPEAHSVVVHVGASA